MTGKKIVCVSAGKPERFFVHPILSSMACRGYDVHYVFDTPPAGLPALDYADCHVRGESLPPQFMGERRQWAEDRLIADGEAYIIFDDNVRGVNGVPVAHIPSYPDGTVPDSAVLRSTFVPLSIADLCWYLENTFQVMDKTLTKFGAYALEENLYFRKRRFTTVNYCRTQIACAIRDPELRWDMVPETCIEDFVRSVQTVVKYGSVVVDRWMKAVKTHFEKGGIGSLDARRKTLERTMDVLMSRYPGLLRRQKTYHCVFAKRQGKGLDHWRRDYLATRTIHGEVK